MLKRLLNVLIIGVSCLGGGVVSAQKIPSNASFNIVSYAGQVVYVDFWASWCVPCKDSFPFMADIARQFGDDLAVVAINVDEDKDDALAFLEHFEHPFEIVYDSKGELASGFDVPTMPTSFIFDRQGEMILLHRAFKKSHIEALREFIAEAIDAPG